MHRTSANQGASGVGSNNYSGDSSRATQSAGGQAHVSPRERAQAGLPAAPAMPAALAQFLNSLKQRCNECKPNEADFKTLDRLLKDLHSAQRDIEKALRDYASHALVAGMCEAFARFVGRLDTALQGKAKRELECKRKPLRDKLPLCCLDPERIESLCLGLSALVSQRSRQPFPPAQLTQARAGLGSISAKLMRQMLAWGGTKALAPGRMLIIHNLLRREITADMLDARDAQQEATRTFCEQVFATIVALAAAQHSFDGPHNLGKSASQIEMLYDHALHGLDNKDLGEALEKILAWLTSEKSVAQMLVEAKLVAFSGAINLVKRFLEQGMLDPDQRRHDAMWERLVAGIASLDAAELAKQDIRSLTACANLLRTVLKAGLPQIWLKVQAKEGPDLAGLFAKALAKVLASIVKLESGPMHDLQNVGNLLSLIEAAERQMSEDEALFGSAVSRKDLQSAAEVLVQALPLARLAGLRNVQTLTNLFNALGSLWHGSVLAASEKVVQCLLKMLDALAATPSWDPAHADSCLQILVWLIGSEVVSMDDLQAVLDRLYGRKKGGWSEDAMLARLHQPRGDQSGPKLQLQPPASAEAQPRPLSPRLVGETVLKPEPAPSGGETWRAADWLSHAVAQTGELPFLTPDRSARSRRASPSSIFPIEVRIDPEEEAATTTTTTDPVNITTTGTALNTMSSMTTTTTTATTTTAAKRVTVAPSALDPLPEAWRLLRLPVSEDPFKRLPPLAQKHPEILKLADEQGHDLLWHLVLGGKPRTLAAMIQKFPQWQPSMEQPLEQEVLQALGSRSGHPSVVAALEALLPSLGAEQRQRLATAIAARPPASGAALETELVLAIKDWNVERVTALLANQAEHMLREDQIRIILYLCVVGSRAEILRQLLSRTAFRAQLDAVLKGYFIHNRPPLFFAVLNLDQQRLPLMEALLQEKDVVSAWLTVERNGLFPLEFALEHGIFDMARLLFGDGAAYGQIDWSQRAPLMERAARMKGWDLVEEMLKLPVVVEQAGRLGPPRKDVLMTALYYAVAEQAVQTVRLMLDHASIRASIFTLCTDAIKTNLFPSVAIPPSLRGRILCYRMDPISKAIEIGNAVLVELFLALDEVKNRLAQDRVLWKLLVDLARDEMHPAIEARLKEF